MTRMMSAAAWREYEHTRDRQGRFIQKGDKVRLSGGLLGKVIDITIGWLVGWLVGWQAN